MEERREIKGRKGGKEKWKKGGKEERKLSSPESLANV